MPMTNFERDFARMFPESAKADRALMLRDQLTANLLRGEYSQISLDSLPERLADTESFWSALEKLVVEYNTDPESAKQHLGNFMVVIQVLAEQVALDSAPVIEKLMMNQAAEDFAEMRAAS